MLVLELNVFNEPVDVSIELNLPFELDISFINAPVVFSSEFNLPFALDVNVFSEPVVVSIEFNLPFALDVYELKSLLIEELADSRFDNLVFVDELKVFNEPVEV